MSNIGIVRFCILQIRHYFLCVSFLLFFFEVVIFIYNEKNNYIQLFLKEINYGEEK